MSCEMGSNKKLINEVWQNCGKNIRASRDGISVARSGGKPRERSFHFWRWVNNVKRYPEACTLLFLPR